MSKEKTKYTFWQRVENFFYYYKWRVIVVILVVLAVYFLWQLFPDTTKTTGDLTVVSALAHPLTAEDYDLDRRLNDVIADVDNDGEKTVAFHPYYITEKRTSDADVMSQSQLESHFSEARGDLLIFDAPNLAYYLKKDLFAPLEDYVDLSDISEEDIVRQNGVAVCVKLTNSKMLSDMRFIIDEVYAGVLFIPDDADDITLKSRENTKAAIAKLLEKSE